MRKEILIFLIVGSSAVLIDFTFYHGILWLALANINIAKGLSFIAGTLFAYFANRAWTFGHKDIALGSIYRFALLYATTLLANILVNNFLLGLLIGTHQRLLIAFIIATFVSATLNFVGMKWFVFKETLSPT